MDYWLTQRLERRTYKREGDTGLDVDFQLEYMGSSEFEWGNVPKALKKMREAGDRISLFESTLTIGTLNRTVYFVCDERTFQAKREAFDVWLEKGARGQEYSAFPQVFAGDAAYHRTIAWWSLDTEIGWTLDADLAPLLLAGLRGPALATI